MEQDSEHSYHAFVILGLYYVTCANHGVDKSCDGGRGHKISYGPGMQSLKSSIPIRRSDAPLLSFLGQFFNRKGASIQILTLVDYLGREHKIRTQIDP